MIKYFIKTAFRYFQYQKVYTLISISILAVGLASSILIFLWVNNELGSDKFHEKLDNLFLVTGKKNPGVEKWTYNAYYSANILKEKYPEIEEFATICPLDEPQLSANEKTWFIMDGIATQQGFLNMFGFELLYGDRNTALIENNSILLTQEIAEKLFGEVNPIGKTIYVRHTKLLVFEVELLQDLYEFMVCQC